MRSRLLAGLVAFAVLAPGAASAGARASAKLDPQVLIGPSPRAIVGFRHSVGPSTIRRLAGVGVQRAVVLKTINAVGVWGPRAVYEAIARWSDVSYVDDDSPIHFSNYAAKKDTRVTRVRAGARPLHHRYTGKGVTVAVMDTGINHQHPDLNGRVIKDVNFEPAWVFDEIDDGDYSDRIAEGTGNGIDTFGHGTHVAGILAGTGAAGSGEDFSGVAPGVNLVNLKIADVIQSTNDIGWEVNALVAYEWAIEHRNDKAFPGGLRVISNSWGIYEANSDVEPITMMVAAAARKGLISVFAAGNAGPSDNTVDPGPNGLPEVITVAAACKSVDSCGFGNIADFSSRGPQVDVAAPGDTVFSTFTPSEDGLTGGHRPPGAPQNALYYTSFSGTSMATPHVSGIVALMLEANPKLTLKQVQQILARTARDEGAPGFDHAWGHGEVDAFAAVEGAEQLHSSPK